MSQISSKDQRGLSSILSQAIPILSVLKLWISSSEIITSSVPITFSYRKIILIYIFFVFSKSSYISQITLKLLNYYKIYKRV